MGNYNKFGFIYERLRPPGGHKSRNNLVGEVSIINELREVI